MAVIYAIPACKKSNNSSPSVVGTWELRIEVNGFSGAQTNFPNGNGNLLKFTQTTYAEFENHQQIKSGSYQMVKDSFTVMHRVGDRIIYDNETNVIHRFITIDGNKLKIEFDGYDTPSYTYEKMPLLRN